MSHTIFVTCIANIEGCLEEASFVGKTFIGIVIILLLYVNVVFLMERIPYDLDKELKLIKEICVNMGIVNTGKAKPL